MMASKTEMTLQRSRLSLLLESHVEICLFVCTCVMLLSNLGMQELLSNAKIENWESFEASGMTCKKYCN